LSQTGHASYISDIAFTSPTQGWCVGLSNSLILKTSDAGASWIVNDSAAVYTPYYSVQFLDSLHGWVAGAQYELVEGVMRPFPLISYTEDGGALWTRQPIDVGLGFIEDFYFLDDSLGWAVGASIDAVTNHQTDLILHTTNGGESWDRQSSPMPHPVHQMAVLNADSAWATTWNGIIWTGDGGNNWALRSSYPNMQTSIALTLAPNGTGWAAGTCGHIYRTTDFFATLEAQSDTAQSHLQAVDALTTDHAWAVGDNGLVVATENGTDWDLRNLNTNANLNDVSFYLERDGWIAGDGGRIWHTADSGLTWQLQNSGTAMHAINAVQFVTESEGWAAAGSQEGLGVEPLLLHTTNGGQDWLQAVIPATHPIMELQFTSPTTGWVVSSVWLTTGFSGEVFRTTDGGANWELQFSSDSHLPHSLCFVDSLYGWMLLQYGAMAGGGILHTTDGGENWTPLPFEDLEIYSLHFSSRTDGWISIFIDHVLHTTSGGLGWSETPIPTGATQMFDFDAASNGCVWGVGVNAHILNYCDSTSSLPPLLPPSVPQSYSLTCFPNPFNSSTTIAFDLPQTAHISLRIFDLLGRQAAVLRDGMTQAGHHQVTFDGSRLASGIYFARLETGAVLHTTKLMLLK
jgi:photosystem II stability/assembly factor-like uncharacterized protein